MRDYNYSQLHIGHVSHLRGSVKPAQGIDIPLYGGTHVLVVIMNGNPPDNEDTPESIEVMGFNENGIIKEDDYDPIREQKYPIILGRLFNIPLSSSQMALHRLSKIIFDIEANAEQHYLEKKVNNSDE